MAEDQVDGDGFKPIDPEAKDKLVAEKVQRGLSSETEPKRGLLSVLVGKFEAFKNFLRLDFLRKKGKRVDNYMLDTDAYKPVGGQVLMESPEVNEFLGSSAQKKVGQP